MVAGTGEYADWLSRLPWSAFLTLTYGDRAPSFETALRDWGRLCVDHNLEDWCAWYAAAESGKLLGRTHVHALVWDRMGRHQDVDMGCWRWRQHRGFTRIEAPRSRAALLYIAKYATKGNSLWMIGGENEYWRAYAGSSGCPAEQPNSTASGAPEGGGGSSQSSSMRLCTWRGPGGSVSAQVGEDWTSYQATEVRSGRESYNAPGTPARGKA